MKPRRFDSDTIVSSSETAGGRPVPPDGVDPAVDLAGRIDEAAALRQRHDRVELSDGGRDVLSVVKGGHHRESPLVRDRGRAARDGWSPDATSGRRALPIACRRHAEDGEQDEHDVDLAVAGDLGAEMTE